MWIPLAQTIWIELESSHLDEWSCYFDIQEAVHIVSNPVFHERFKDIKVDCHFIPDHVSSNISTKYVKSKE